MNVKVGGETITLPHELYWSAERWSTEDFEDVVLKSIALTALPCRSAARPVTILPGKLDHRAAPNRWDLDRTPRQLLERAASSHLDRGRTAPLVVHDHRPEYALHNRSHAELAELAEDWQRPPGRMRHSAPYKGILSVR